MSALVNVLDEIKKLLREVEGLKANTIPVISKLRHEQEALRQELAEIRQENRSMVAGVNFQVAKLQVEVSEALLIRTKEAPLHLRETKTAQKRARKEEAIPIDSNDDEPVVDDLHGSKRRRQNEPEGENATPVLSTTLISGAGAMRTDTEGLDDLISLSYPKNRLRLATYDSPEPSTRLIETAETVEPTSLPKTTPDTVPISPVSILKLPKITPATVSESPICIPTVPNIGGATTVLSSICTPDFNNSTDDISLFVRDDEDDEYINIDSEKQIFDAATSKNYLKETPGLMMDISNHHERRIVTKKQSPKTKHPKTSLKANTELCEQDSRRNMSSLIQPAPAPVRYGEVIDVSDDSDQELGADNAEMHQYQKPTNVEPDTTSRFENDHAEENTPTHDMGLQDLPPPDELETIPDHAKIFTQDERFYAFAFQDQEILPDARFCRLSSRNLKKSEPCYLFDGDYQPLVKAIPGEHGLVLTPFPEGALGTHSTWKTLPVFYKDSCGNILYLGHYTTQGAPKPLTRDEMSIFLDENITNHWANILCSRSKFFQTYTINAFLIKALYGPRLTQSRATDQELKKWDKEAERKLKTLQPKDILEAFSPSHGAPRLPFYWQILQAKKFDHSFYNALQIDINEARKKTALDQQNQKTPFQSPSADRRQQDHAGDHGQMGYRHTASTRSETTPIASFSPLRTSSSAPSVDDEDNASFNHSVRRFQDGIPRARRPVNAELINPHVSPPRSKFSPRQ